MVAHDGFLASIFWVAAIFCWFLLHRGWKADRQAAMWAALGPALFATAVAVFLTVQAVGA